MDDLPNIHQLAAITQSVETATDYLLKHEYILFPQICEQSGTEDSYSWKNQNLKTIRCRKQKMSKNFINILKNFHERINKNKNNLYNTFFLFYI